MKLSKTDYRGGEALVLATRNLELIAPTGVGPRITSLRSLKSKAGNLFLELPADEQRYHGYYLRGGHRLWHSPEDIVRTYQPDDEPPVVKRLPDGVVLAQATEQATGLQKTIRVEFQGERTVKVTHTLTNRGSWPVECAAWALTMLRPGGLGVLPLMPKGSHKDGDLLPNYALVPWTFTDLSLPLWQMRRDFLGIDVSQAKMAQKLGLTNYPGWSAYWVEGTAFVKYSAPLAGAAYPDLGCCLEVFTNGAMIELETLGPLQKIAPRGATRHVEYWTVLDGIEKPSSDESYRSSLAPAVAAWRRTLE